MSKLNNVTSKLGRLLAWLTVAVIGTTFVPLFIILLLAIVGLPVSFMVATVLWFALSGIIMFGYFVQVDEKNGINQKASK